MMIKATNFRKFISLGRCISSMSPLQNLEESLRTAVETKTYHRIPDLLDLTHDHSQNPSLFSFLSQFPTETRTLIVDEILQSFIPLRPRSRPQIAYSSLLSHTLQSSNPFPLSLAILQRTLRSGCCPDPETKLILSKSWMDHRTQSNSIVNILSSMKSIGYSPDTGTCNYVISSLCSDNELEEATEVLKNMSRASCVPDSDSFGTVIASLCSGGQSGEALRTLKKMVKGRVVPRQGTVMKVACCLRACREVGKGVEMVELLERERCGVGFEVYEVVAEGCVECHDYVLAGKVVMKMTERGFIPYIKIRQKVVEGLASVGESELVNAIRERFRELGS